MYHDGAGLYLQVSARGAKSWIYRFMLDGRPREMGLGPLTTISLAEARERAAKSRKLRLDGIDPIEAGREQHDQRRLEAARAMTFDMCAAAYIDAHKAGWKKTSGAPSSRAIKPKTSLKNLSVPVNRSIS
jgi:Arm DNA-binding domain